MATKICSTAVNDPGAVRRDWDILGEALPGYTSKDSRSTGNEDIRQLAYLKWAAAGKPSGRDVYFWMEAEREIRQEIENN